jgi:hypothetical protein
LVGNNVHSWRPVQQEQEKAMFFSLISLATPELIRDESWQLASPPRSQVQEIQLFSKQYAFVEQEVLLRKCF